MLKTKLNFLFCLIIVSFVFVGVNAQVTVYNNFGPDNGGWDYNYQMGWTVCGEDHPTQYGVEQAMGFTSTETGTLTDIWVAMFSVPDASTPDTVFVRLALNTNGMYPDPADVLEEWVMTGFDDWYSWHPPVHLEGNGSTILLQDEDYWLWMTAADVSNTGWCINYDPDILCPHTLRREGENWLNASNESASAFRVDVVAVSPESPGLPTYLFAIPEPTGALSCDLMWLNPYLNYVGDPLSELLEMRIYRDSVLVYTDNNPIIGGNGSYTDIPDEPGLYTYHVTAYNSYGEGSAVYATAWVGEAYNGIVILDLDPTPSGIILQTAIENFYTGSIVLTDNINNYPLTSSVDAVFVLLGTHGNNYVLSENEAALLTDYLDNGGNVYMEGGDTWFADEQTSLHSYFNIEPLNDGNNNLVLVQGLDFLSGYNWIYNGGNSSIDNIDPISPAVSIFHNELIDYNCGIAYDSGEYKTIGTSFEITGLGGTNSLEDAVEGIINFFEVNVESENNVVIVDQYSLNQNYPNPFNPSTQISFIVNEYGHVKIDIYNIKGEKIKTLVDELCSPDDHQVTWNGTDDKGNSVASGIYFYKMKTDNYENIKKMILMK